MHRPYKFLFVIKGGTEWMGGLHYIRSLIQCVSRHGSNHGVKHEISVLVHTADQVRLFKDLGDILKYIHVIEEELPPLTLRHRALWSYQRRYTEVYDGQLDGFIRKQGFDFVYPALTRRTQTPYRSAEWIPDFQFKHFPEGSNPREIEERKADFARITSNAPLIYFSSEHALRDCKELFPVNEDKLAVMRFCAFFDPFGFKRPLKELRSDFHIPEKFFMVSNLLAPTKNLDVVIRAVSLLKKRGIRASVVVSGDIHDYRNPDFKHRVFQSISRYDVREEMIMLGLMDRIEQKQLLVNSLSIIQPSRFEGWNTLVEEAKALDHDIILSDIPVHVEQAPARGFYFRDDDENDLAAVMEARLTAAQPRPEVMECRMCDDYLARIDSFAEHFVNTSLGISK